MKEDKFKTGDHVILSDSGFWGKYYESDGRVRYSDHPRYNVECHDGKAWWCMWHQIMHPEDFYAIEEDMWQACGRASFGLPPLPEEIDCSCDSLELFRFGCKCKERKND